MSSFHWGTGSGMAGIEIEEDFFRDAIVDVAAGRGVGVNGLNVVRCTVHEGGIPALKSARRLHGRGSRWLFSAAPSRRALPDFLNGAAAGSWSGADLAKGIPLSPAKSE